MLLVVVNVKNALGFVITQTQYPLLHGGVRCGISEWKNISATNEIFAVIPPTAAIHTK